MNRLKTWITSHPMTVLLLALAVGVAGISFLNLGGGNWGMAAVRFFLSAIMIGIIVLAGGAFVLRWSGKKIGYSLKKCAYALALALVPGVLALGSLMMAIDSGAESLAPDWVLGLLSILVLCLCVGIFEEALFRGIVFEGLLARFGTTRKGLLFAMVVSALIFGGVHVISFFFTGEAVTGSVVLQLVLKTVQTAMVGFLLAAVYYKTRNLWGVVIVHALNDVFALAPQALMGESPSAVYATTGAAGDVSVFIYGFFIVVSIPFIITAWKIVKNVDLSAKPIFELKEK